MKFIHTADWHLGNTMHDIDRTGESEAFLSWLKNEIVVSGAQALVIAGDIFDVVNPSNCAKSQYYRFLASLHGTCCTNVVVVGGNHDSGALLDAPAELLEALNMKVVGSINNRCIDDLVVELKNDAGEVIGLCCAVPFMRDAELENFYKRNTVVGDAIAAGNATIAARNAAEVANGNATTAAGDASTVAAVNATAAPENSDSKLLEKLYADVYNCAVKRRGERNIPIIATGHLYAADLSGRDTPVATPANATAFADENATSIADGNAATPATATATAFATAAPNRTEAALATAFANGNAAVLVAATATAIANATAAPNRTEAALATAFADENATAIADGNTTALTAANATAIATAAPNRTEAALATATAFADENATAIADGNAAVLTAATATATATAAPNRSEAALATATAFADENATAIADGNAAVLAATNATAIANATAAPNRTEAATATAIADGNAAVLVAANATAIATAAPNHTEAALATAAPNRTEAALATAFADENATAIATATAFADENATAIADGNAAVLAAANATATAFATAAPNRTEAALATATAFATAFADENATALTASPATPAQNSVRHDDGVRDVVGTLGNVEADAFPSELDYVALGHIHYATMVAKNPKVRYSGSPFVMGFDEARCKHCVLAVEANPGATPQVEKIIVPRTVRYEQFEGDVATLRQSLRNLEAELLKEPAETYVDILLTSGDFVNLSDALENEEAGKHFMVKRHRIGRNILKDGAARFSDVVESTKQYTKEDYFKMLIASKTEENVDSEKVVGLFDKFISLFNEAVEKAHENG